MYTRVTVRLSTLSVCSGTLLDGVMVLILLVPKDPKSVSDDLVHDDIVKLVCVLVGVHYSLWYIRKVANQGEDGVLVPR